MNIKKRDDIQKSAFETWKNNNKIGSIQVATGIGKTFIFLHGLHSMPKDDKLHLFLAEVSDRKTDLLENIRKYDEIFKCDTLESYNLQFHCYQSVYKWKNTANIGLVCADEIHDAMTPAYSQFFENNSYDALMGLSAKIDTETSYTVMAGIMEVTMTKGMYIERYCPIIFKYSINDARKDNLNRDLTIHLISHELDNKSLNVKAGSVKNTFYQTEKQSYDFWNKKFESSKLEKDYVKRNLFQKIAINKRSKLLYGLESKVIACRKLLKVLNRTIIFGNSVDALLRITPYTVTSRNSDAENEYYRRQFDTSKINTMASFKKLKQGANIRDLQNMILMSYYSKEKDVIQRFGRLRIQKDNKGNVFIFVTKNTIEEEWYKSMLEDIVDIYKLVKHDNVDQCIKYITYEKNK